jgi:phosphoglycolate phosphatase
MVRALVSRGAAELVKTCFGRSATDSKSDLEAFRSVYCTLVPSEEHLYPGARSMLQSLHAAGCKLAICTNKPQKLTEGMLAALGFAPLFGAVVGGDVCSRPKPDPAHIRDVLSILGLSASEAAYVGDSEVDGEAAAAAKIPFILVRFGYAIGNVEDIACSAIIDHFDQLCPALCRLP